MNQQQDRRFLIIAGVSGSGKNELERALVRERPDLFNKTVQVTTRAQRADEPDDTYEFIDRERYHEMESGLIGRTHFLGNSYGTKPESVNTDRVNTIILNRAGFVDFREQAELHGWDYFFLGLDVLNPVVREGRDAGFVAEEARVLRMCDFVFVRQENGPYVQCQGVVDLLVERGYLPPDAKEAPVELMTSGVADPRDD
jgi:hypothetical protein